VITTKRSITGRHRLKTGPDRETNRLVSASKPLSLASFEGKLWVDRLSCERRIGNDLMKPATMMSRYWIMDSARDEDS